MNKIMKFLHNFADSFLKRRPVVGCSILRVSSFSTKAELRSSSTLALYQQLKKCFEQRISLMPVLDKWVIENGQIHVHELKKFIINFRKSGHYEPALEIAEWISDRKAENFFNGLDDSLIDLPVYGALLNCDAEAKSLEKAEAIMEKKRNMKCCTMLDCNAMLSLYSKMGMHEKVDSLVQEMENKGIGYDTNTYNIMLNAYAGSDLEAMEKLLMKMEDDPLITVDFCNYVTAAKAYIKAGALEKTTVVLTKAEHLMKGQQVYGILITLYATMQRKEDVYRVWNLFQNSGKLNTSFYASMINSLEKLDDLDGVKKILEEWEERNTNFDIRIPNLIIYAYCKKGQVGEAEIILKRLRETGKVRPTASTSDRMAHGYFKNGQMEKAIEMVKKAFLFRFPGWKPDLTTIAACLEHLKNKGDADETQEFLMLHEKCGNFSVDFKERGHRYLNNGGSQA